MTAHSIAMMKAWLKASRLPSQTYIFFPLLLGQGIAYSMTRQLSLPIFVMTHLFGLFIQLYIVYANDYADYEADQDNETYTVFTGGSRTLVMGMIHRHAMKKAIFIMVGLNIMIGVALSLLFYRVLSLIFIGLALLLLWAYSYEPIKLSYRGGGEILQVLGVAILLPIFAFYLQKGSIALFPREILLMLIPMQLSCALSTTLPDYPSDKKHEKRTFSVLLNPQSVKVAIIVLNLLSMGLMLSYELIPLRAGLLLIALPFVFTLSLLTFFKHAQAGTDRLFYFVFLNIASLIVFVAGTALYFFLN